LLNGFLATGYRDDFSSTKIYFIVNALPSKTSSSTPTPIPTMTQLPTINTGAYQPQAEPFLTTLAIATVIVVAAVGAGLLVYFKKHKP
jgi:hypothetical protein